MTTAIGAIPYPELIPRGNSEQAKAVSEIAGETKEHLFNANVISYDPLESALQLLVEVYEKYSDKDWDGYSALPISTEVYYEAQEFLKLLDEHQLPFPDISPEVDGGIEFEWYLRPDYLFTISFTGKGIIGYSGLFEKGNTSYGTEKFHQTIPSTICQHINRFVERYWIIPNP